MKAADKDASGDTNMVTTRSQKRRDAAGDAERMMTYEEAMEGGAEFGNIPTPPRGEPAWRGSGSVSANMSSDRVVVHVPVALGAFMRENWLDAFRFASLRSEAEIELHGTAHVGERSREETWNKRWRHVGCERVRPALGT